MRKKVVGFALSAMLSVLCVFAEAQQSKRVPLIGYLSSLSPVADSTRNEAFRQGLKELGYIEEREDLGEENEAMLGLSAKTDPVLAELWDNKKDAEYDRL